MSLERKVQTGFGAGTITGLAIWLITSYVPGFESGVPEPVVNFLNWVIPIVVGFITAFIAKHTDRPGLAVKHKVIKPEHKYVETGPATPSDKPLRGNEQPPGEGEERL